MKRPLPGKGRPHGEEGNEGSGEDSDEEQPEEMTSQFRDDSESGEELDEEEDGVDEGDGDEDDDEEEEDEDEDDDEASSGYDSAEEEKIKKELQEIPFEVLERLQETGHAVDPAASKGGQKGSGKKRAAWDSEAADREFKRANKNRPQEMSSKRPVARFREVVQSTKREVRDPRFESLSGKFNNEAFRKRYKFFYDEELPKEAARLKTVLAREKNETKKAKLQGKLTKVQQQMKQEKDTRSKEAWEREQKAKERKLVEAGKKPFFQRKSEKRKAEMVRKYQELKDTGKLEKFMEKKRRKNAAKDHRLLPSKRR